MRYVVRCFLFAVTVVAISCSNNVSQEISNDKIERISFNLQQIESGDDDVDTKSTITDLSSGYSITWNETDTVGIYPNTGSQVYFSMADGVGTSTASFDGGGWAFKYGALYYSYLPFIGNIYLDRTHIPVSFEGQVQNGLSSSEHAGSYYYMYTPPTSAESGTLAFNYRHLCCLARFNITIDAGTYTKLSVKADDPVFIVQGYYDLTAETPSIVGSKMSDTISIDLNNFTLGQSGSAYVYVVMAPVDINGKTVKVTITDASRTDYECLKTPNSVFVAGKKYGFGCSSWTKVPQSMGVGIGGWETGEDEGGVCN